MFNFLDEDFLPFSKGIRELPGRPHVSTGYRLIGRGCRGVKLESIVVGGRRYVSRQALRRFVEAVTLAANSSDKVNRESSKAADSEIEKLLDEEGL